MQERSEQFAEGDNSGTWLVGVSKNQGGVYRRQYSMILIRNTPKKGPPNFWLQSHYSNHKTSRLRPLYHVQELWQRAPELSDLRRGLRPARFRRISILSCSRNPPKHQNFMASQQLQPIKTKHTSHGQNSL